MAKAKSAAIPESVRRQLASLKHRVSWLEAALKPKKKKAPVDRFWAGLERKGAQQTTHADAMREYHQQERIARYRENPNLVKIARELERKENEFLRSKGLTPKPSTIPKEFQRRVRASRKTSSAE